MSGVDAFRLDGSVALVTGVGRGIGQAIAIGLAQAGADIAGIYRTRYEDTQARVRDLGRRFSPLECDLNTASVAQLGALVERVVGDMGRLDILINNAGVIRRTPALHYSEADWDEVIQVNLKACFFLAQAAAAVMAERGSGKIVNIASLLSYQGGITVPAYTASKSGLIGVTRALANEWAALGVNVNAIVPGYIATDNTAPLRADPVRNPAILARIPAGRWGDPSDLQGAAVFLSSSAANYIHGTMLAVDGGWLGR